MRVTHFHQGRSGRRSGGTSSFPGAGLVFAWRKVNYHLVTARFRMEYSFPYMRLQVVSADLLSGTTALIIQGECFHADVYIILIFFFFTLDLNKN